MVLIKTLRYENSEFVGMHFFWKHVPFSPLGGGAFLLQWSLLSVRLFRPDLMLQLGLQRMESETSPPHLLLTAMNWHFFWLIGNA